eukprot:TRINITY_DN1540_c0_g1_i1.p2 TRINITY_DN1540_c0_g1~~TRINITY_DN1540_c0_g1_i1.p2  ORF type:complete len:317 (-),score=82.54 TRINITY_DN1540_c0_g1_i1:1190-2140(-)
MSYESSDNHEINDLNRRIANIESIFETIHKDTKMKVLDQIDTKMEVIYVKQEEIEQEMMNAIDKTTNFLNKHEKLNNRLNDTENRLKIHLSDKLSAIHQNIDVITEQMNLLNGLDMIVADKTKSGLQKLMHDEMNLKNDIKKAKVKYRSLMNTLQDKLDDFYNDQICVVEKEFYELNNRHVNKIKESISQCGEKSEILQKSLLTSIDLNQQMVGVLLTEDVSYSLVGMDDLTNFQTSVMEMIAALSMQIRSVGDSITNGSYSMVSILNEEIVTYPLRLTRIDKEIEKIRVQIKNLQSSLKVLRNRRPVFVKQRKKN